MKCQIITYIFRNKAWKLSTTTIWNANIFSTEIFQLMVHRMLQLGFRSWHSSYIRSINEKIMTWSVPLKNMQDFVIGVPVKVTQKYMHKAKGRICSHNFDNQKKMAHHETRCKLIWALTRIKSLSTRSESLMWCQYTLLDICG